MDLTKGLKRGFDVVTSAFGLLILSPILVLVSIGVLLTMGSPVLFKQVRPGKDGRQFLLYKFRTMLNSVGADGRLLSDAERVTKFGAFLRRTSIDELPELFNVLKGEMSLVGPRPLLFDYLPHFTPHQARRHLVRPGLTGLAQVSGRQEILFSKRLELDVWYVDNWSLKLDLLILLRTIPVVFGSRGVIVGQEVSDVDDIGLSAHVAGRPKGGGDH